MFSVVPQSPPLPLGSLKSMLIAIYELAWSLVFLSWQKYFLAPMSLLKVEKVKRDWVLCFSSGITCLVSVPFAL